MAQASAQFWADAKTGAGHLVNRSGAIPLVGDRRDQVDPDAYHVESSSGHAADVVAQHA